MNTKSNGLMLREGRRIAIVALLLSFVLTVIPVATIAFAADENGSVSNDFVTSSTDAGEKAVEQKASDKVSDSDEPVVSSGSMMLFSVEPLADDDIASGECGTCTWVIDDAGVLTIKPTDGVSGTLISGSNAASWEWHNYRNDVTKVVVEDGVIASSSLANAFDAMSNCTSMDIVNLDTTNVTNMLNIFRSCRSLTTLDVSSFDTSNVTSMSNMFSYCSALTSLDFTGFDTSNVTSMSNMFLSCSALTSLDLTGFDTSNVTDMIGMFLNCSALTSLDVTGFDTSNVTDMNSIFSNCSSLTSLDVTGFDTSKVKNMSYMFNGCDDLPALDVSGFDTSKVTSMSYMFKDCSKLTDLDVSKFDTSKVKNMSYMFYRCSSLTSLDVSNFNTSNVTDMTSMFYDCSLLTSLDVSNWNTSNVKKMYDMFDWCTKLASLDVSKWDTSNVTTMGAMFSNCRSLPSIDVSNFDTSDVTDMLWMFNNCSSLTSLDLSSWDTANVNRMQIMFANCSKLNQITVGTGWDPADDYEKVNYTNFFNVVDSELIYTPKDGYAIKSLTIDGEEVEFDVLGGTYPNFTGGMIATIEYAPAKTVTFEDNGTEVDEQIVAQGGDANDPYADPSRIIGEIGMHFIGWDKIFENVQQNITVYALYELNDYVLTFDANGGEGTMAPVAFKYGTAQNLPENAFTREGHTFIEWNTKADGSGDAYADKASVKNLTEEHDVTVTLYAQWEINKYTVTFMDSADDSKLGEETVDYGTAATAPSVPSSVIGWATEKNGKTEADLSKVTEDMTVWAIYRAAYTGTPSVVFEKESKSYDVNEEIKFKAIGFWADSKTTDFVNGDERYVPTNWHHADPSGDFGGKTAPTADYSDSFKQTKAGDYTLKVEFAKSVYEGGTWVDDGTVTVETEYKVVAPSGGSSNGGSAEGPKTGDNNGALIALYALQIAMLVALACFVFMNKAKRTADSKAE